MEQYARKRRFSTIAVGQTCNWTWDEDQQIIGVHPYLILRDLLADGQCWLYTKTLTIGYLDDDDQGAELDEIELQDAVAQFELNTRLLETVVEVQRRLYPKRDFMGETEAAASLLIAILPNLQKIRFVNGWKDSKHDTFLGTLHDLLEAALSDKHDLTDINSFGKLTEVGMYGLEEHCGANYDVFNWFIALPSIRTIKGQIIDGLDGGVRYLPKCSKVESLTFYQSAINASAIRRTLRAIRGLQSFAYDFWVGVSLDREKWEPRQIIQALEFHTRKSLLHLEFTSNLEHEQGGAGNFQKIDAWRGEPFIDSLCAFEVLEKVRLETVMLNKESEGTNRWTRKEENVISLMQEGWEAVEEKWERTEGSHSLFESRRLVDVLPASIRQLRLVGGLSDKDAIAMLENLPALKEERLPNLLSIFFEDVERSDIDANVVRECEEAGVKMEFWQPSA